MENQLQSTIRVERARKNISQEQLANYVGVSKQTICNIETGKYQTGLILAFRIATYFELTIEELFTLKLKT